MNEQEIEESLGAYVLDAVDAIEREEIEAHLEECPRCRAEVAAHREVAALLASTGATVPGELWSRIAAEIAPELPDLSARSTGLLAQLPERPAVRRRRARQRVVALGVAAVVALVTILSLQIATLSNQVHTSKLDAVGMSAAVNSVLSHPHRSVLLTSKARNVAATIVFGPDGNAYWVDADLPTLSSSQTYQLWALVRKSTVVSLGVVGANPHSFRAFRVDSSMSRLMVTVEPKGGTVSPTTPVLVSASL